MHGSCTSRTTTTKERSSHPTTLPTAGEEKIMELEANFNSAVKLLNKKVSCYKSLKKKAAKLGGDKQTLKKKDGDHPKKWKAPKQGNKKEVKFKCHSTWYWCGKKDTGGKYKKCRAYYKPKECKGLVIMDATGEK
ncbi:hypothetical protein MHU86_10709 [Fragilaria crotonensis]|nr:hypothetical protein MHU86_10709 [Fragilaria crotonensis]